MFVTRVSGKRASSGTSIRWLHYKTEKGNDCLFKFVCLDLPWESFTRGLLNKVLVCGVLTGNEMLKWVFIFRGKCACRQRNTHKVLFFQGRLLTQMYATFIYITIKNFSIVLNSCCVSYLTIFETGVPSHFKGIWLFC